MRPQSRRSFIVRAAAASAVMAGHGPVGAMANAVTAPQDTPDEPGPVTPLRILFLGGTGFVGPHFIRAATARGHTVTLFNRGRRAELFPELELITGNRIASEEPGLAPLQAAVDAGRRWDVVIDTASVHRWVEDSAAILNGAADRLVFISTMSVYADASIERVEGAPVEQMPDEVADGIDRLPYDMRYYGAVKARCEAAAERHFPGRATVLRPGLIVGPRDRTHRFTYWPHRARAGGELLAPGAASDPVMFIDGRDVAAFMLRVAEQGSVGIYNTNGPISRDMTIGRLLETSLATTGATGTLTWVDPGFLRERGINPWSQMPVWIPPVGEYAGFHRTNLDRATAAGLTTRPLNETIRDTLTWFDEWQDGEIARGRPPYQPGVNAPGITRERESEVLAEWHARKGEDGVERETQPADATG